MILTVGVCLLFCSVPVMADQAEDEAAIRKATQQFMAAYNKKDTKAVVATIGDNCQNWLGTRKSRADYVKWYEERFEQQKTHQRKLSEEVGIDFITPDIAIHKFRIEFTGWVDADGKPVPPGKRLLAWLYMKKNGQWMRRANFGRQITEE